MKRYVIALDQGTTSSRAIIFDHEQRIVAVTQKEFTQYYPQEGYVEHDPTEIYASQYGVLMEALAKGNVLPQEVAAIGITNQRETTILWERETGRPVYNAIVWQCRRTAPLCEELERQGLGELVHRATGLRLDAYFSATKVKWILDQDPALRERAKRGEILFGTVDSWLVWKLTNGQAHVTDYTNACRTMMFNIHTLDWDEDILRALDIPRCMLPQVKFSDEIYGTVNISGVPVPIAGIAGDQQAALFGQRCFQPGDAKNTYGTGCFLLMNTGDQPTVSQNGLLTTIGIAAGGHISYALEGSVFVAGAVIQWLRDELGILREAADSEYFAQKVPDNGGVFLVPAFTGLGAPHWDMYARGTLLGITRGTNRNHIIRAALESIAYQANDVIRAMERDSGLAMGELRVDGGASANNFLMQFQADITGAQVIRPLVRETTALGAAYLAGLSVGFWRDRQELLSAQTTDRVFSPAMEDPVRQGLLCRWNRAVQRARNWARED